ncbi:hypothetical protein SAMN02745121_08439 [Nannocystis exedens]|uniref:Lipoprotein n=2 Tax=Nannocystis exedens TaxID=54 RepID=A0A1I2I4U8_9BACT|nr:hypothetical protein NAEX_07732 [Nannocystis exedens]SFF37184.1 hypothetical protein SAMN02745121_08439 [Nannocystis exedens]
MCRFIVGLMFIIVACARNAVERDGFVLERDKTEELLNTLLRRATFDFNCPADRLHLRVLAVHDDAGPDMPKQVGVTGCDKQATYSMEFIPVRLGPGLWAPSTTVEGAWKLDGAGIAVTTPSG